MNGCVQKFRRRSYRINKARKEFKVEKIEKLELAPTDADSCARAQLKILRGLGTEEDRMIKFKEYWNRKCVTPLTTEELLLIEGKPDYIPNVWIRKQPIRMF